MCTTNEVKAKVHKEIERANKIFDFRMKIPSVIFSDKMYRMIGQASYSPDYVKFSLNYMEANSNFCDASTITHEVCHLVAYYVYGTWGHDKNWKHVMRMMGITNPKRLNDEFKKILSAKLQHIYECSKCGDEIQVGNIQHKRLTINKNFYNHKNCRGSNLIYKGVKK